MKFSDFIKSIFCSWDIYIALVVVLILYFLIPGDITYSAGKEIFTVSISVLSIIFSVFFAALAVLITAGDNEFVRFLEENGTYKNIVWTFRMTLLLLFTALVTSIGYFVAGLITYDSNVCNVYYPKWSVLLFSFLATYSLFAAVSSTMDAIKYAEFRARFIKITNHKDNQSK